MSESVATGAEDFSRDGDLWGHPKGLYVCFTTELWERFSFYGMKYLLLLYLTKYHLFSDAEGLDVLGSYAGLVYALPLIGGMVADRFLGMRKSVVFGGICLSLGHILMAIEGHQAVNYAVGHLLTDAGHPLPDLGIRRTRLVPQRKALCISITRFQYLALLPGPGFRLLRRIPVDFWIRCGLHAGRCRVSAGYGRIRQLRHDGRPGFRLSL